MTKQEIIKIIVVALIGAFSKSFFDNILAKYIPDKNKLNSYIKSFLLFNLRYTLLIYFLVRVFINDQVDKAFILKVCIYFSILVLNITLDLFSRLLKIVKQQIAIHEKQLEKDVKMTDAFKQHLGITEALVKKLGDTTLPPKE